MYFLLFIMILGLLGNLIGYKKTKETSINEHLDTICIVAFLILVIAFWREYDNIIPKEVKNVETTVTTYYDGDAISETKAFVDFDVSYEKDEDGGYYYFEPHTIYWPDGSYSILEDVWGAYFGRQAEGGDESFWYRIDVPKKEEFYLTRSEKLHAISPSSYVLYPCFLIIIVINFVLSKRMPKSGKKKDEASFPASYDEGYKEYEAEDISRIAQKDVQTDNNSDGYV